MPRKCSWICSNDNENYWILWHGRRYSIDQPKRYGVLHVLIQESSVTIWDYSMTKQTQEKGENRSRFRADSQNFPMVLPLLSCSPPSTFRSNNTIIQITQQASTAQMVSFGIVIFNENKAWLFISQQNKSFRHGLKPNYILVQPTFTDWYANIIQISYSLTIKLHLLIMSTFIQIPNRINQLTSKSKLDEIFTYAAIRSQIKDNNL